MTGLGTPHVSSVVSALDGLGSRAASKLLHAEHVARRLRKIAQGRKVANPGVVPHGGTAPIVGIGRLSTVDRATVTFQMAVTDTGHISISSPSSAALPASPSAGNVSVAGASAASAALARGTLASIPLREFSQASPRPVSPLMIPLPPIPPAMSA